MIPLNSPTVCSIRGLASHQNFRIATSGVFTSYTGVTEKEMQNRYASLPPEIPKPSEISEAFQEVGYFKYL